MGLVTGIIVFILVWWVLLFTVLPFGHVRDEDGTPQFPHMKRKFLITTAISVLVWVGIYGLIEIDVISFQSMAEAMMMEDYHS